MYVCIGVVLVVCACCVCLFDILVLVGLLLLLLLLLLGGWVVFGSTVGPEVCRERTEEIMDMSRCWLRWFVGVDWFTGFLQAAFIQKVPARVSVDGLIEAFLQWLGK